MSLVTRPPSLAACLCLIVLVSAANTHAVTADNPYQAIVGRNVFSLKPPPPALPPEDPLKKNPPPVIKLQGLQTILGRRQVLFKVPAKPPGQPKEESFVMNEGERQGEIEVVEINMKAEAVRFKNHGLEQLLNMKEDADKPVVAALPPGPPPGPIPGALPGLPSPTAAPAPSMITTIGSPTIPQRTLRTPTTAGGGPAGGGIMPQAIQAQSPFSREEQEVLIEVNRLRRQQEGDPHSRVLPPTSITPGK